MERSYYLVSAKPQYREIATEMSDRQEIDDAEPLERVVLEITQGGFGLDVVDDERQVKERFLEHLFMSTGIDLPRSVDVFDRYFEVELIEVVNLDSDA